jgi:hypothetical protein
MGLTGFTLRGSERFFGLRIGNLSVGDVRIVAATARTIVKGLPPVLLYAPLHY